MSWDSIKQKFVKDNGITYANKKISNEEGAYEIQSDGVGKWVVGSTLCLNLKHIDKIPAFYNPEENFAFTTAPSLREILFYATIYVWLHLKYKTRSASGLSGRRKDEL